MQYYSRLFLKLGLKKKEKHSKRFQVRLNLLVMALIAMGMPWWQWEQLTS